MKWLILFLVCVVLGASPVSAHEGNEADSRADVPNVVGMQEDEAKSVLESFVLSDGKKVEVIINYEYNENVPENQIIKQDEDTEDGKRRVIICVSMGKEPQEHLGDQQDDSHGGFGISEYVRNDDIGSQFGIDWDALPESYENNWDNSESCWEWGVWIDGKCYKTERGTFNTDVRHKVQGYCDGTYVYIRLVMSREYGKNINGDNYEFWLDGKRVSFQIGTTDGKTITNRYDKLEEGTHQVEVRHGDSSLSGEVVPGSLAYVTKHSHGYNAVLEMRIPLSEMQRQNPKINLDRLAVIEFFCSNLMYRRYRIAGASTFPMALAAVALVAIPSSSVMLGKHYRKKKTKIHE